MEYKNYLPVWDKLTIMAAVNLNHQQFNQAMNENKVILVDYWAPWCGYCRRIGPAYEKIAEGLSRVAEANGFEIAGIQRGTDPYLLDKNWDVITELNKIANEQCGTDSAPYTVGGGTYAHVLPNALVFGMNGCLPPDDFAPGFGSAHGKDESVSLDRLQRGMRIYARTLLKLNDMEW